MDDFTRTLRRVSGRYIPFLQPYWDAEDLTALRRWLAGGALEDVRERLAAGLQARFPQSTAVVLTDTGKSALVVTLRMLGVEPGGEVVVPSYCCLSVILGAIRAGCTPVLADCDEHFNISVESVNAALSPRTNAILVPHLFGLKAASLEAIIALGRQRGIAVIEDVAQAFGLRLEGGAPAGSLGDAAIFSAGLGKPLMGPAGGWAIMNRRVTAMPHLETEAVEETRNLVADFLSRFTGPRWRRGCADIAHALPARVAARLRRRPGFDLRQMAEQECRVRDISMVDGFLAGRQIERIDRNIELRRANARRWKSLLTAAKIPCATLPDAGNMHTAFPLLFKGKNANETGRRFRRMLERGGVATETCYTPLHLRSEGKDLRRTAMPVCESAWRNVFSVSVRPNLTPEDWTVIEEVVVRAGVTLANAASRAEAAVGRRPQDACEKSSS